MWAGEGGERPRSVRRREASAARSIAGAGQPAPPSAASCDDAAGATGTPGRGAGRESARDTGRELGAAAARGGEAWARPGRGAGAADDAAGVSGPSPAAAVLAHVRAAVGAAAVDRHLGGVGRVRVRGQRVELCAANRFAAELVERRLGEPLRRAACEVLGEGAELVIVIGPMGPAGWAGSREAGSREAGSREAGSDVAEDAGAAPAAWGASRGDTSDDHGMDAGAGWPEDGAARSRAVASRSIAARRPRGAQGAGPTPDAGSRSALEHFVVGEPNRRAAEAVRRLATGEGAGFGSVFLYGACGVGKTHLLRGAARLAAATPGARVLYMNAEEFIAAYVDAVRERRVAAFQKRFRGLDVLCVDDVHFLAAKEGTQLELLHRFNELESSGARVLLAADTEPGQIPWASEALASRVRSFVGVEIGPPDAAMRPVLLHALARRRELRLTEGAAALLSSYAAGGLSGGAAGRRGAASARDLEGLVTQVQAMCRLQPQLLEANGAVGERAVRGAMAASAPAPARRAVVRVEAIVAAACEVLGVDPAAFAGGGKHARVVVARGVAAYLSRELTSRSFPEISAVMGRRSHTTVITADHRVRRQLAEGALVPRGGAFADRPMAEVVSAVRERLGVPGVERGGAGAGAGAGGAA